MLKKWIKTNQHLIPYASFMRRSFSIFQPFSLRANTTHLRYLLSCSRALPGVVTIIFLAGCSSFPVGSGDSNSKWSTFTDKVDSHGTRPVVQNGFDQLPLVEMLEGVETPNEAQCVAKDKNGEHAPISYQCAAKKFYIRTRMLSEAAQRMERNRIQERILAVSEDRCNSYKKYLRYDQSMSNFWLGAGATLAGGLGALSSTLTAAKTYAAAGGVLSGFSAEYNQNFYGNLFYSVITKAIDEQRHDAYRQIQAYGQDKNLADYPVEAAIKDAILYDGTCSAVSAMEYAEKAVQLINDPGMDSMMRYFVKANQSHYILQNNIKDISELKKAGITATFENSRFGSKLGAKDKPEPLTNINSQLEAARQQTAEIIVENIGQRYATNDDKKQAWANRKDKPELITQIKTQLGQILQEHSKSLLLCAAPAEALNDAYLKAQAQLSQVQDSKDPKRAEAQIKREQALNGLEQINIEVTTIIRHFNELLEDLTNSALDTVSKSKGDDGKFTLNWELPADKKYSAEACAKFKVPEVKEPSLPPSIPVKKLSDIIYESNLNRAYFATNVLGDITSTKASREYQASALAHLLVCGAATAEAEALGYLRPASPFHPTLDKHCGPDYVTTSLGREDMNVIRQILGKLDCGKTGVPDFSPRIMHDVFGNPDEADKSMTKHNDTLTKVLLACKSKATQSKKPAPQNKNDTTGKDNPVSAATNVATPAAQAASAPVATLPASAPTPAPAQGDKK